MLAKCKLCKQFSDLQDVYHSTYISATPMLYVFLCITMYGLDVVSTCSLHALKPAPPIGESGDQATGNVRRLERVSLGATGTR